MIRHALDTLPNCLPSSRTPTFVLITLSAVVISSLPSFSSSLILDYEDFITTVRLNCSTYTLLVLSRKFRPAALSNQPAQVTHISRRTEQTDGGFFHHGEQNGSCSLLGRLQREALQASIKVYDPFKL